MCIYIYICFMFYVFTRHAKHLMFLPEDRHLGVPSL